MPNLLNLPAAASSTIPTLNPRGDRGCPRSNHPHNSRPRNKAATDLRSNRPTARLLPVTVVIRHNSRRNRIPVSSSV